PLFMMQRPPSPSPLPYTTLFRSDDLLEAGKLFHARRDRYQFRDAYGSRPLDHRIAVLVEGRKVEVAVAVDEHEVSAPSPRPFPRSEEHTSELQSRENLVCRLLLE